MDKITGQRPFTDEELAQALQLGTEEAACRQSALRAGLLAQVQAPERRRPLWHTLAASAAAVVLLVAALLALAKLLPQRDVVQQLATKTPNTPGITLTTNIQRYTPALSSVQGITITAKDSQGNAIAGDWKASWGVFLGPVSEQGHLIPRSGEYTDALPDAARTLWSFAPDSGEIPANIRITFTAADGQSATLLLTQDRNMTGFVRVAASVNRLMLLTNTDHYTYDPESPFIGSSQMLISAVDAQGNPVDGDWAASFGAFGGNATNGFVTTMKDTSGVAWDFVALIGQGVPQTAEITFTAKDGATQTLHLQRDPQDNMTLRVRADEIQPLAVALEAPPTLRCNAEGCANQFQRNSISALTIEAVDVDGSAVTGVWKASFGELDGSGGSLTSSTRWSFSAEDSASIPQTAKITFYARDGLSQTLHLDRDADNPNLMKVRENELVLIPRPPSTSAPVATASATSSPTTGVTLLQMQAERLRQYLRDFPAIPRGEAGFAQEYHGDWDDDGKQDHAFLSDTVAANATDGIGTANGKFVTIAFGNGTRLTADARALEQKDSWGNSFLLQAADLNGDGKNEIILLIDLGGQGGRGSYGLYPYALGPDGWNRMEAPTHGYPLALDWQDGKATVSNGQYHETVADTDMLQAHYNADHSQDQWNQVQHTTYHSVNAADIICDISLAKKGGRTVVKICQYTVGMTGVHVDELGYLITTLSWDIQGKCTPIDTQFVLYPQ